VREIRSVVVSCHVALYADTVHSVALCGDTADAGSSQHIHGEVTVADVAFEVGRWRVGHEAVSVTESIDHRLRLSVDVQKATRPHSAVATTSVQDEHGVVDLSPGKDVDVDIRRERWFRVFGAESWGYCYICEILVFIPDLVLGCLDPW
jgi:hypothetical protein